MFVGIVIVETYPIATDLQSFLWDLEVAIALVFSVEYVLRLYGAPIVWRNFSTDTQRVRLERLSRVYFNYLIDSCALYTNRSAQLFSKW